MRVGFSVCHAKRYIHFLTARLALNLLTRSLTILILSGTLPSASPVVIPLPELDWQSF